MKMHFPGLELLQGLFFLQPGNLKLYFIVKVEVHIMSVVVSIAKLLTYLYMFCM